MSKRVRTKRVTVFESEQFDDDFYDGLRSRANAGEITYVLASHVPLHKIALANNFWSNLIFVFGSLIFSILAM